MTATRAHRRSWLAGALTVLLLAPTAGCASSEEDQVREVVDNYGHAQAGGDGQTACSLLSGPAQRQLLLGAALVGARDCPGAIAAEAGFMGPEEKAAYNDLKVSAVTVTGDHAEVPDSAMVDSDGHPVPLPSGNPAPVTLQKFGDTWLITNTG